MEECTEVLTILWLNLTVYVTARLRITMLIPRLLSEVDLVLYDLKAFEPYLHQRCTGVDNRLIILLLKMPNILHLLASLT